MILKLKYYKFSKNFYLFSGLEFFLICLQTLIFQEAFSTNNTYSKFNNESSLADSKNKFFNIDDNNNTSVNKNDIINDTQKIKIIAAGDFGCSPIAKNNIKQIEFQKPDIFLVLGDLSYEPTMDCWYDMTKTLNSKIKIAIGNHEDEEEKAAGGSKELKDSLLEHYNLQNSYYSFNYGNVHFLILDTQLEFSFDVFKITKEKEEEEKEEEEEEEKQDNGAKYNTTTLQDLMAKYNIKDEIPPFHLINEEVPVKGIPFDTQQYLFAVNDLKKANNNSSIEWIIVIFHKPLYSSLSSHMQEYIMREKYQPLFDQYGVDMVLQGHNHLYDRTLPLLFNSTNISEPIIDKSNIISTNKFVNPEGSIYSVVGLGGRSSHIFLNQPDYVVKQHNGFGFLSIEIEGSELGAKYYDIGYKCKQQKLKESDLEDGDFVIFDMSTCKNDRNDNLEIIDHYIVSKIN